MLRRSGHDVRRQLVLELKEVKSTTLARELGWTQDRLEYALGVLDRRLRGVGKRIVRGVAGVQIVRDTPAPDPAVSGALADQLREGALNATHVRSLAKIAAGEITRKAVASGSLGNAQQTALGALINAGFVLPPPSERKAAYELADDGRLSLLMP